MKISVDRDGAQMTVTVDGELDAHNCAQLGEEVLGAELPAGQRVVIDAASLRFIDSSAISELLKIRQVLVDGGGEVSIVSAGPSVRRVLEITGLLDTFGVS